MNLPVTNASTGDLNHSGMTFPHPPSDRVGVPVEVAEGVWWIRLPVGPPLDEVNVYALRDDDGLTLVDTGAHTEQTVAALHTALQSPELKDLPLRRVIVTHFHPDHIGTAGYLATQLNASLWMTRTCWLSCSLALQTSTGATSSEAVSFMRKAGLSGIQLEAYRRQAGFHYAKHVAPLPEQYTPLLDLDTIRIGSRTWKVVIGNGHAAEHATLWCEDLAIVGDQILPNISASLAVPFTEAESDLVSEWMQSCNRLARLADNQLLVLPGHQRPFTGCLNRLRQIEKNIEAAMQRITRLLVTPKTAFDFVEEFHNRTLTLDERKQLLPELVGFLNHLAFEGKLDREVGPDGAFLYRPKSSARKSVLLPQGNQESPADAAQDDSKTEIAALMKGPRRGYATLPALAAATAGPDADSRVAVGDRGETTAQDHDSPTTVSRARVDKPGRPRRRNVLAATALLGISAAGYAAQDQLVQFGSMAKQAIPELTNPANRVSSKSDLAVPPISVQTYIPEKLASTELPRSFTGVVKAKRASEVGFNRIGILDKIPVERGQRVKKDEILAEINNASLKANLKAIGAQMDAAVAKLDEMLAGPRTQTIDVARNEVSAAKAQFELAETSLARSQRLVRIGAVSEQAVEEGESLLKSKRESLNAAENALDELLSGTRSEQVRGQRAVLAELAASKEQVLVQLQESTLAAPFDAIVAERFLDPGAVVSPGQPVVRLVEVAPPEAWIGLPPEYIDRLSTDQTTTVRIGSRSIQARLKTVLPELDMDTRTNTAVFELANLEPGWGIGRSVEIELAKPMEEGGFWVSMSSIIKGDQGLWAVLALEPSNEVGTAKLVKRELEVILVDSDRAYVRGTLQEGEPIVASGLHRLTPGQIVRTDPVLASGNVTDSAELPTL